MSIRLKRRNFETGFRFLSSAIGKTLFGHDHGGRCTNSLDAVLPSFLATEDLDFHPQIVDGNLERIDDRKANGILLGGDHRADVSTDASLQKLTQLIF